MTGLTVGQVSALKQEKVGAIAPPLTQSPQMHDWHVQEHLRRASQVSSALESRVRQEGRTEAQAHAQAQIQALKQGRAEAQAAAQTQIQALLQEREDLQVYVLQAAPLGCLDAKVMYDLPVMHLSS